jgi:hypothetical protein
MAFGQSRREREHPVVVPLDMVERSAPPDVLPGRLLDIVSRISLLIRLARDVARGRGEPRLDRLEARWNWIGDSDEPPLLRQVERERDADKVARVERGAGRAGLTLFRRRVGARDPEAVVARRQVRCVGSVRPARLVERRVFALWSDRDLAGSG